METDPQSRLSPEPDRVYNKKTIDNSVQNTKNENVSNKKVDIQNAGGVHMAQPQVVNIHQYALSGRDGSSPGYEGFLFLINSKIS